MENIHEPTRDRAISTNRFQGKDTRLKPLASKWIEPVNGGDAIPATSPDWTPELQNSWIQVVAPLEPFAFRLHYDGSLEFKGHLDSSGGAVTATIAFTLPGIAGGEPDYTLDMDQYWHTTITNDTGTTFTLALVFIDSTTGDVTISWPAV